MILVTGATGFVGRGVVTAAVRRGLAVRGSVRSMPCPPIEGARCVLGGDLTCDSTWLQALAGVDTVVHAAARVHVMRETVSDPLAEFRRVNVDGTVNLALQSAAQGVRRFILISSIKVNGERTVPGVPFRADDVPAPHDPYGVSKLEAEMALRDVALRTGLEVVIVRPVLVYGPGVKANVAMMMRWLRSGVPLPFGAIENRRSMVSLGNLADLVMTCVTHRAAPGHTFLVSDGEDLSTTQLLRRMAMALGVTSRLVPLPSALLRMAARTLRRDDVARRLLDSLQVDIESTKLRLEWTPPIRVDEALAETAQDFIARESRH